MADEFPPAHPSRVPTAGKPFSLTTRNRYEARSIAVFYHSSTDLSCGENGEVEKAFPVQDCPCPPWSSPRAEAMGWFMPMEVQSGLSDENVFNSAGKKSVGKGELQMV